MLRRAFVLLISTLGMAACQVLPGPPGPYGAPYPQYAPPPGPLPPNAPPPGPRVAILLPLSGPRTQLAQAMLKAAQLALGGPGNPSLDPRDTRGTPEGAARAAHEALAAGDGLILGPLTGPETAAVAPIARRAGVGVLAFSNDAAQAQPGVWVLGITPGQQVRRLVSAAQTRGRTELSGLFPENEFGRAMSEALVQNAGLAGLPPPAIQTYRPGTQSVAAALRGLLGPAEPGIPGSEGSPPPPPGAEAPSTEQPPSPPPAPPPFNGLVLADTGGRLAEIASLLKSHNIAHPEVQIMGPALWAAPSSGSGQVAEAWYAAPDPAARNQFDAAYRAKYGGPAPGLADLAYDAAAIARVAATDTGGFSVTALAQPQGYNGADGLLALLPDGHVRRALALFAVKAGGGGELIEPAPASLMEPGV
ncbi:MAG: penicillin-binding protein activator [Acetobacteraceae bacterium]|nr:penicillin-binding protein activator [Acetobacteraceae bacterium]